VLAPDPGLALAAAVLLPLGAPPAGALPAGVTGAVALALHHPTGGSTTGGRTAVADGHHP
jgi:hypothetical protein